MTYWINTVSRGHVRRGVAGGFTQANHGRPHMLRRMARGDWVAFYSPRTEHPDGARLQAFTAIGRVADDEVYQDASRDAPRDGAAHQEDSGPLVQPWRRRVDFLPCVETPIRPLLDDLDFIVDKVRWGYRFRAGVFTIGQRDFGVIRTAMTT